MKLQPLYDLQQEINRLFIAGSKFSKGDPRIQKQIPVFQKLGEKAPVFQKIASDLEELVNADTQQTAEKLTAISTLLYSVLYTQGEITEADVEIKGQQPGVDIKDVNTSYSYLQLKPVTDALSISNPGRMEILKDALERNIFEDSRTFHYLVIALGDKYSELADYVEKTIILRVGKPMIPFLIQGFSLEDKTENIRKLRLLNLFKYEKIQELIDKILSGPYPNLQAEVVNILSNNPDNETLIIQLADDKNKVVREAAYYALARLNTRESLEKLKDVYLKNKNKTNLPAIAGSLAASKLPFFFQEVFNQVFRTWEEFISLETTAGDKVFVEKLDKLSTEISIFQNKEEEQVVAFFDNIFANKKFSGILSSKKNVLGYTVDSLVNAIIACLNTFGEEKELSFYARNGLEMPDVEWKNRFCHAYLYKFAGKDHSKEKIYELFAPAFDKKAIYIGHLHDLLIGSRYEHDEEEEENDFGHKDTKSDFHVEKIDPRWLSKIYGMFDGKFKWSYEMGHALEILDACEPAGSKKFNNLLIELAGKVEQHNAAEIFNLIVKREIPNRFEIIYSAVSKIKKMNYYGLHYSRIWKQFPKEYVSKFQQLYKETKVELFNHIAEEIQSED